jgi:hypothetical protein
MNMLRIALAGQLLFCVAQLLHAAQPIVIRGKRRESSESRRSGHTLVVRPQDASRFDTQTHLRRESSLVAPETGRISASGFLVPKIRGQEVKYTDVYLEDTLLQDPYSGLPLLEDLDLRAFGTLELHQGISPPEVSGINPTGSMRYRFREARASSNSSGVQVGDIYGQSLWNLSSFYEPSSGKETHARLYVRHHHTRGTYPYYSDEGTPFNVSDDRIRERENNDQRSWQVVPFVRKQWGPTRVQAFGWVYQAERGLPSLSAVVPSSAREQPSGGLATLQIEREISANSFLSHGKIGIAITESRDRRKLDDPGKTFLSLAAAGDMQVKSRRVLLQSTLAFGAADLFCSVESTATGVKNRLDRRLVVDLERRHSVYSLGMRLSPVPLFSVELKTLRREQRDSGEDKDQASLPLRSTPAASACFAIGDEQGSVYVQTAYVARSPSLGEEFGDGGGIKANRELSPEASHHREIGGAVKSREDSWRLGVSAYEDTTENKIVLVPVLANAFKALNVRKTIVRGYDLRGEVAWTSTSLYANYSRLFPYDITRDKRLILPGVAAHIWAAEAEQRWGDFTCRWLARYRSALFRDLSNALELPGAWTHDASCDYKTKVWAQNELRVGISVRNLFNLMSVEIRAPDTERSVGRTAFSDVAGAPLPGRQWLLSLELRI